MPQVKLYIGVAYISVKYSHLCEEVNMLQRLDWILDTTEEVRELDGRNDEMRKTLIHLLNYWKTEAHLNPLFYWITQNYSVPSE
jgi:hypothetical protein